MQKRYVVRLSETERSTLLEVISKLKGTSEKVRRAHVLLKADADGPAWTDGRIADAFGCSVRAVENIRERFVTLGFALALDRKKRSRPPRLKLLDGEQEAEILALRLGPPPAGFASWSLRLLARQAVALELVESVSHETLRRLLKKAG
jgi:transposase